MGRLDHLWSACRDRFAGGAVGDVNDDGVDDLIAALIWPIGPWRQLWPVYVFYGGGDLTSTLDLNTTPPTS
jgi:hypothetical protein